MLVLVLVLVLSVVLSQLMVEINTNPGLAEKAGPDAAQICAVVCTAPRLGLGIRKIERLLLHYNSYTRDTRYLLQLRSPDQRTEIF